MRHFEAGPSFSASRPLWGVDRADESETVSGKWDGFVVDPPTGHPYLVGGVTFGRGIKKV